MPRVAILGASGFLGTQIVSAFESKDWEVIAFSRKPNAHSNRRECTVDLFDESTLRLALLQTNPEIVLSTAWDTEHGKFWTNESNIAYRDATLRFAELSFELGAEAFFGLGTMSEYGTSPGYCNSENSPLVASDIYSKCKIETGLGLRQIGERFGGRTHWGRVFQAFGPNEKHERFVPSLITKLRRYERFSINTPNFEMDWIHSSEVASAVVFTVENKLSHFVDIGTGVGTTVRALSELICEELQLDSELLDFSMAAPGHKKLAVVDSKSLLHSQGWQATESLRSRIRSLRYTS
jgi:dTDP-6-deoxy-L-talose 4-dehydrogenase (NAD+)